MWADDTQQLSAGQLCTTGKLHYWFCDPQNQCFTGQQNDPIFFIFCCINICFKHRGWWKQRLAGHDCWFFSLSPIYKTLTSFRCNILLVFSCPFYTFPCLPLANVYLRYFYIMPCFILLQYNFSSEEGSFLGSYLESVSIWNQRAVTERQANSMSWQLTNGSRDSLLKGGTV